MNGDCRTDNSQMWEQTRTTSTSAHECWDYTTPRQHSCRQKAQENKILQVSEMKIYTVKAEQFVEIVWK